jgi:hypothetical protein
VINQYEVTEHSGDENRWRTFIRRAEALYALACNLADSAGADGLAGNFWVSNILKTNLGGDFDVRPNTDFHEGIEQYLSAKRGNFGQFYIASMTQEKFLSPSSGIPLVSEDLGRKTAKAFHESAGHAADDLLTAIKCGVLPVNELKKIGFAVHPSNIPPNSEEMALLRAFLLAEGDDTNTGKARRSSCWLLLDLIRKGIPANDEGAIRRAFYNRTLPDGSNYSPVGQTAELWRAYQANELCHIVLEVILNALVARLQRKPTGETPDTLIAETIAPVIPRLNLYEISWQNWATEIGNQCCGDEEALASPQLKALQDAKLAEDQKTLDGAITLLAVLWTRWRAADSDVRKAIGKYGRRSLNGIINTLDSHATVSTIDTITRVIRRKRSSDHTALTT